MVLSLISRVPFTLEMPPPRDEFQRSMEALIHHFKHYTEGLRPPAGEAYVPVESPRGELGFFVKSDGSGRPVRIRERAPSFANLQALPRMAVGTLIADLVAIILQREFAPKLAAVCVESASGGLVAWLRARRVRT